MKQRLQYKTALKSRLHTGALLALVVIFCAAPLMAQSGGTSNSNAWGGTTDIFDYPVGARAMAMGGAYVTAADDPFALYWNPSALENVQTMSLGFYHTTLPAGTNYDFLSFTYPTVSFGTFSAGVLRIATGNIPITDVNASRLGTDEFSRMLFMTGYGKKLFKDIVSVGATLKIDRLDMPGFPDNAGDWGTFTETAFGGDIGMLVYSPFDNAFLRNWTLGFNYQNAFQRAIQLADSTEPTNRNLRMGASRMFLLGDGSNHLLFSMGLDRNQDSNVPNFLHLGSEFGFRNFFMLRLGYNKRGSNSDGYGLTYGFGVQHLGFRLDYSYWNGVDSFFGSSHRISVTANIGLTREEKRAAREAEQIRRIQEEARKQYEKDRRDALYSGMSEAREFFQDGDYVRAAAAINKVLALDEEAEDAEFDDARALAEQINTALEEQRQREIRAEVNTAREEAQALQQQRLIDQHYEQAMAYFESEQYRAAMEECDRALAYDPDNEMVLQLKNMANEDLKRRIADLIKSANDLQNRGRSFDALQLYNQALPLARGVEEWETFISGKIRELDQRLEYENLLRRAVDYENNNQWAEAAEIYQQALRRSPNNQELQKRYREANARANARQMEMTPEVKELYTKGYRALRDRDYDMAIQYYEQALELQPLNKTILRALDHARNQKRKAANGTPAVN